LPVIKQIHAKASGFIALSDLAEPVLPQLSMRPTAAFGNDAGGKNHMPKLIHRHFRQDRTPDDAGILKQVEPVSPKPER